MNVNVLQSFKAEAGDGWVRPVAAERRAGR